MSELSNLYADLKETLPSLQSIVVSPEYGIFTLKDKHENGRIVSFDVYYGDRFLDLEQTFRQNPETVYQLIREYAKLKRMYYLDNTGSKRFVRDCWLDRNPKLLDIFEKHGIKSIFEIPENRAPTEITEIAENQTSEQMTNFVVTYDENYDIKDIDFRVIGMNLISLGNKRTKAISTYLLTIKYIYDMCVDDSRAIRDIDAMIDALYEKYQEQIDTELEYSFLRELLEILLNLEFFERENPDIASLVYQKACTTLGMEFDKEKYRT